MSAAAGEGPARLGAETREALVRVLADEGRDALTRVALAASELDGAVLVPAFRGRIEVIQAAVSELESLLGRVDRLTRPAVRDDEGRESDLPARFRSVLDRVGPALAARGLRMELGAGFEAGPSARPSVVRVRASDVDLLCTGFLRWVASASSVDAISIAVVADAGEAGLVARLDREAAARLGEEGAAVCREFEVAVAAAGGRCLTRHERNEATIGFLLPRVRVNSESPHAS